MYKIIHLIFKKNACTNYNIKIEKKKVNDQVR